MASQITFNPNMEGNVFEDIMSMEPTEEKNVFKAFKLRQNFAKVSVFGGQLVSQCIVAACKTVDPLMECHNAQLNFLSGIVVNEPLKYKVLETRNGKSFATRMVHCYHGKNLICECSLSFHRKEIASITHQGWFDEEVKCKDVFLEKMPTVPGPEELEEESTVALRFLTDPKYNLSEATKIFIEFADRKIDSFTDKRPVDPELYLTIKKQTKPNKLFCWIRPKHTIPNTSVNAKAFLSYVSDYGTVESALKPHTSKNGYIASFTTSLNHVIYFHHSDFDVNDWLLYETDTPNAFAGRAIIFCRFWTRDGRLVATVIQECLIRAKTISKI